MRRAFTLIELLVVMAIISILASILFPVFNRALDKARTTQCLSNVKQVQLAVMMYASDYDGCYPPRAWIPLDGTPSGTLLTWATGPTGPTVNNKPKYPPMLLPYFENSQILVCPSMREVPVGYAMNWWMIGPGGSNAKKSSEKVTFVDGAVTAADYTTQWYAYPVTMSDPDPAGTGVKPDGRHNLGANFAYADGHAKWARVDAPGVSDWSTGWDPSQ